VVACKLIWHNMGLRYNHQQSLLSCSLSDITHKLNVSRHVDMDILWLLYVDLCPKFIHAFHLHSVRVCLCMCVCLGGGGDYNFHNFNVQNVGTGIIDLKYSSSIALCLQTLSIYYLPMKYRPGFTWIQHDWSNGLS
jgi:hypothetical protein